MKMQTPEAIVSLERAARRRDRWRAAAEGTIFCVVAIIVAYSAVLVKEMQTRRSVSPLVELPNVEPAGVGSAVAAAGTAMAAIIDPLVETVAAPVAPAAEPVVAAPAAAHEDPNIRWFNGRPVRPAKTIWMTVTAYSPDERSCGDSADGITASLHSVETNGGKLVAADSRVLPLGSMISVPGYDSGRIVPVLDRGGKIKGNRLDVLYPTHEVALKWGVQRLEVTVWEYADGKPAPDWRKIRDSK